MTASTSVLEQTLKDPSRIEAINRLMLLDTPPEPAFDRLTRIASKLLNVPVSLISFIDSERHFIKSQIGLPEPFATQQELPMSHSLCKNVLLDDDPLIAGDTREHPLLKDNLSVKDLGVMGYMGVPLILSGGKPLGAFCVLSLQSRDWTDQEVEIIVELTKSAITEIELRTEVKRREESEAKIRTAYQELDVVNRQLRRTSEFAATTIDYTIDAVLRGAESTEVLNYLQSARRGLDRRHVKI